MKRAKITIIVAALIGFTSCDPDVATEGIDMPEMIFAFKVNPDTAYLKIGDTLLIESSISSNHGGVQVTGGEIILGEHIGYYPNEPITSTEGSETCLEGVHFDMAYYHGDFTRKITSKPNYLSDFRTVPQTDSIRFKYGFVFLRKGVYQFSIYPSFYEGGKGKARTSGFFDVTNPHWAFYQIPGVINPASSDPNYRQSYLISVSD